MGSADADVRRRFRVPVWLRRYPLLLARTMTVYAAVCLPVWVSLLLAGVFHDWWAAEFLASVGAVSLPTSGWLRVKRPWMAAKSAYGALVVALAVYGLVAWPLGRGAVFGTAAVTSVALHVGMWREKRRASRPAVESSSTPAPRFALNAPDPAPGQCPVCGLEDLGELGVHDEMAREIDPDLVRVVAYGPHRAHYACAAVVPYVAPPKPSRHHCFGFYTPAPGERWTYCGCEEMREPPAVHHTLRDSVLSALPEGIERDAQRITIEVRRQAPQPTTVPGVGRLERDLGWGAYWTCKFCETKRWAASWKGAEWALIEHARTCEKR